MSQPSNVLRKSTAAKPLDRIDRVLLRALQDDARRSNKELADLAGLSPSACFERVKRLRAEVLRGVHARVEPAAVGFGIQVLIAVELRVHSREAFEAFAGHLREVPEVVDIYSLSGRTDFLVRCVCRDTAHLQQLTVDAFTSRPEVSRFETSLVFWSETRPLPISLEP
jgi:DNA-binding Lrp family transcriptional regulator